MPFSEKTIREKTYNQCIPCDMRPHSCSGPNPFKLRQPRLGEWLRLLRDDANLTNFDIAQAADVSEMTVYRVLHGENVTFDNMQRIIDVLWPDPEGGRPIPCPAAHRERFTAIEAENVELRKKCQALEEAAKDTASAERLAELREDSKQKINHLKEQIKSQDRLLQDRYEFLKQKDSVIERRETEIAECEQEIKELKKSAAEDKRTRRRLFWMLAIAVIMVITLLILIAGALVIDYRNPDRGFFWVNQLASILDFASF